LGAATTSVRLAQPPVSPLARAQAAAIREQERADRAAERARAAGQRELAKQYAEGRVREANRLNQGLQERVAQLGRILVDGLQTQTDVDFESLKKIAAPAGFDPGDLGHPEAPPTLSIPNLTRAAFSPPAMSLSLWLLPGGRRRYHERVRVLREQHRTMSRSAMSVYERTVAELTEAHGRALEANAARDHERRQRLQRAENEHRRAVLGLEREVERHNRDVDRLRARVERGDPGAILSYIAAVLSKGLYGVDMPLRGSIGLVDSGSGAIVEREMPSFDIVPSVGRYRYVKARDEIVETAMPAVKRKGVYVGIVCQLALLTAWEVFRADPSKLLETLVFTGYRPTGLRNGSPKGRSTLITVTLARRDLADIGETEIDPVASVKVLQGRLSRDPEHLASIEGKRPGHKPRHRIELPVRHGSTSGE
jgi:restriction system protein